MQCCAVVLISSTIYQSIISQSNFCNRIIFLNNKSVKLRNPKNPIDEATIFHKIWLLIHLKTKIIDIAHIGKLIQKAILVLLNFSVLSSVFILSGFNYSFIINLQYHCQAELFCMRHNGLALDAVSDFGSQYCQYTTKVDAL